MPALLSRARCPPNGIRHQLWFLIRTSRQFCSLRLDFREELGEFCFAVLLIEASW